MRVLIAVLLIGCGSSPTPDACTTAFTGNVTATVDSATACATLGAGPLAISINSAMTLMISIDLGQAPAATMYSSETVMTWSALGERTTADGGCVYAAGNAAVPTGSFTLTLASIAEPHGELQLVQYVQAMPETDCGAGDHEMVDITF